VGIVRLSRSIRYPNNYTRYDVDLIKSLTPFLIKISYILKGNKGSCMNLKLNNSKMNQEISKIENKSEEKPSDDNMLFISNIVHDIRTPANSLYGFLELIETQIEDKRLKEYIQNAKESASFINTLTDSLLDKAKDKYIDNDSSLEEVNSIKFFSQIANSFSANMFNKEIDYIIFLDPHLPKKIVIDKIKLKRIIINLIGNAYKFTPIGKRIKFYVSSVKDTNRIKISIRDYGIGIAKDQQENIFKAFQQAEDDINEKYGGTGLGLAISAKYVKDMGGKLLLKSKVDSGSEFSFEIEPEIRDNEVSREKFKIINKKITILTDKRNHSNVILIIKYLTTLGMPRENIVVNHTFCTDTTHLFCFQHKLSDDIINIARERNIELLVIEESLFTLKLDTSIDIISMNTYYGDTIHSIVLTQKAIRVLLADDNKINISLLKAILEDEYCELVSVDDGAKALETLKNAHIDGRPFDMIFLDKYMPSLTGSEVIREFRMFESRKYLKPIYAISITGDPVLNKEDKLLFDLHVTKPFRNTDVKDAFKSASILK
jgi:nitrogen-specific signal transduction histidine kinase/CheY-like chemotaxis protein